MRTILILCSIGAAALATAQQTGQSQAEGPSRTYTSGAEVKAMIARAKKERKPNQANFIQSLVKLAPYDVNLEYRNQGVDSPATVHEAQAELIYVVEGAGTLVTGGKLIDGARSTPGNLSGKGIEGGTPQRIAKEDFVFVPENTPHAFIKTEGTLVIMSVHLPRGGSH